MKKEGVLVTEKGYPEKGTGYIKEVKKTVIKVDFNGDIQTWDFPHAKLFLEKVE